ILGDFLRPEVSAQNPIDTRDHSDRRVYGFRTDWIGVCVASAGALSALAGGPLSDAIQAMAFAGAQIGAWWGTGEIIARSMLSGAAHFLLSTGLHGVVGGALSLMQGGSFVSGAAAGAFTETAQSFFGGLPRGPDVVASAVIGGTASVLTG